MAGQSGGVGRKMAGEGGGGGGGGGEGGGEGESDAEAEGGEVEEEEGGLVTAGRLHGGLADGAGWEDGGFAPFLEGDKDGEDGGVEVAALGRGGGGVAEGEGGGEGGEAGGEEAGVGEGEGGEGMEEMVEDVDEGFWVGVGEEVWGEGVGRGGGQVEEEEVAVQEMPWRQERRQLCSRHGEKAVVENGWD